jgi:hypothetical protein
VCLYLLYRYMWLPTMPVFMLFLLFHELVCEAVVETSELWCRVAQYQQKKSLQCVWVWFALKPQIAR